ncbi:MAG: dihydrofolate reductase [Oscillibacter sp.]|nr:dihydrofolate reductase [Oscillibacter sp.]
MQLSIIVAASENHVIGRNNALIWHLSADLKHFKALTTGHAVIMGRKTFESIGKALPNRRNVVISRNPEFMAEGCEVTASVEDALALVAGEEEVFVIGGGRIYNELWSRADRLYLTRVHTETEGDTYIPAVDKEEWELVSREDFKADEKNEFDYSFLEFCRKNKCQ